MIIQGKALITVTTITATLLLVPLIAMQFTDEVIWTLSDFAVAGVLLLGTGLLGSLIISKVNKQSYRIAICLALLMVLLVIWAELAVGMLGTPFAGS
jgi:hypothetical protein